MCSIRMSLFFRQETIPAQPAKLEARTPLANAPACFTNLRRVIRVMLFLRVRPQTETPQDPPNPGLLTLLPVLPASAKVWKPASRRFERAGRRPRLRGVAGR